MGNEDENEDGNEDEDMGAYGIDGESMKMNNKDVQTPFTDGTA